MSGVTIGRYELRREKTIAWSYEVLSLGRKLITFILMFF